MTDQESEERLQHADRLAAYRERTPLDPNGVPMWLPDKTAGTNMHFPPLANGLDYLASVVDHLTDDELGEAPGPRDLKYAVLHLDAAAEVLLKARLRITDWTLVCQDATKVTPEAFQAGDFQSCGTKEAVKRLRKLGLTIAPAECTALTELAKLRNKLQHHGTTDTRPTVEARIAKVLDLLVRFLHAELLPQLDEHDQELARGHVLHIRAGLNRIESYVDERMQRLAPELRGLEDRTLSCPRCFKDALVANDDSVDVGVAKCHFCQTVWPASEIAADYITIQLAGLFNDTVEPCTTCGQSATVVRHATRVADLAPDDGLHDSVHFCFACAAPAYTEFS